ncbi:U7 snRNA-associated Sm-like protein LSm11 [Haliotis rufescens]|uniref:U7 snRNA-associated Sm-like protein LSm11 n=1 Tax=Haliotis rufescens TaxID=6454 RepID=UPI00201F6928|nr:U7 snRNA-associated Sm-like protein LSm11 [Haliotis rufescens]
MAAPTDNMSDVSDEELNLFSSNFDPLRALYSTNIPVQFPDVRVFNNVAEYESKMQGKGRARQDPHVSMSQNPPSQTASRPKAPSHKPSAQGRPVLQMPDASMHSVRRRMLRNVLTRMDQSFISGPLSILRRCVQEKLQTYIWTRSACSVRGILRGYVVAFDKHFNLAMIDVDEVYRIPSVCRKKMKKMRDVKQDRLAQERSADVEMDEADARATPRSEDQRRHFVSERLSSTQTTRRSTSTTHTHQTSGQVLQCETPLPREAAWLGLRPEDVQWRHVNQLFIRGDNVVCVNLVGT